VLLQGGQVMRQERLHNDGSIVPGKGGGFGGGRAGGGGGALGVRSAVYSVAKSTSCCRVARLWVRNTFTSMGPSCLNAWAAHTVEMKLTLVLAICLQWGCGWQEAASARLLGCAAST
jgi:hypothetical protein